jgi:hypothetical protein
MSIKTPLGLFALIFLRGCTGDLCGNNPLIGAESPDKKHPAIVFVRDCRATTEFSTQVSILDTPRSLSNEPGNVLVLDGKYPGSVRWEGNKKLVISGLSTQKQFLKLTEFQSIEIKYEQ